MLGKAGAVVGATVEGEKRRRTNQTIASHPTKVGNFHGQTNTHSNEAKGYRHLTLDSEWQADALESGRKPAVDEADSDEPALASPSRWREP